LAAVSNSLTSYINSFLTGIKLREKAGDLVIRHVTIGRRFKYLVLKLYLLRSIELRVPPCLRLLRRKTVIFCIVDLAIRDVKSLSYRSLIVS